MQINLLTLASIIFASAGFCTTLVVVGVYIGSFNSKFVKQNRFENRDNDIQKKMCVFDNELDSLRLEIAKMQAFSEAETGQRFRMGKNAG